MEHVAGGVAIEQGEEVRDAAPADVRRFAIDRRQVHQELLQCPRGGGRVRQAVHAQRFGGYSLSDLGLMVGIGEQLQVGMGVHVNEAGADHVAAGVNGAAGVDGRSVARDDPDRVAGDSDAAAIAGGSGAVDHRAVGE